MSTQDWVTRMVKPLISDLEHIHFSDNGIGIATSFMIDRSVVLLRSYAYQWQAQWAVEAAARAELVLQAAYTVQCPLVGDDIWINHPLVGQLDDLVISYWQAVAPDIVVYTGLILLAAQYCVERRLDTQTQAWMEILNTFRQAFV